MTSTCCQNHKYNINTSPPRSFVLALLTNLPVPDRALQSGLFPISLHHLPFDFFSLSFLAFFFFFEKENTASSRLRACQSLYTGLFSCQSTSPISFFFTWCSELVIRLWLLMPPDTNPVHYSPTYKIMTYPPPTL